MWGTEGLTCGYDGGDRVAPDEYSDAFRFTGKIKRVTLDLSGELIPDSEAEMKIAMMQIGGSRNGRDSNNGYPKGSQRTLRVSTKGVRPCSTFHWNMP